MHCNNITFLNWIKLCYYINNYFYLLKTFFTQISNTIEKSFYSVNFFHDHLNDKNQKSDIIFNAKSYQDIGLH